MKRILLTCLLLVSSFFLNVAFAISPWTPEQNQFVYTFSYTNEFANNFYFGKTFTPLPATVVIDSLWGGFDLGLTDDLALDGLVGYSWSSFPGASRGPFDGFQDTWIGLRYRVLNEFKFKRWVPTITVRIAGIVKGEYPLSTGGNIHSPGDGVNGVVFMIAFGKQLPANFAIAGETAYVLRDRPAFNQYLVAIGLYRFQDKHFSWNVQYRRSADVFGLDIGGPGFTGTQPDFQALRELKNYISGGVGYTTNHGMYIGAEANFVAFPGRNTKQSTIFALYLSDSLGGKSKVAKDVQDVDVSTEP